MTNSIIIVPQRLLYYTLINKNKWSVSDAMFSPLGTYSTVLYDIEIEVSNETDCYSVHGKDIRCAFSIIWVLKYISNCIKYDNSLTKKMWYLLVWIEKESWIICGRNVLSILVEMFILLFISCVCVCVCVMHFWDMYVYSMHVEIQEQY